MTKLTKAYISESLRLIREGAGTMIKAFLVVFLFMGIIFKPPKRWSLLTRIVVFGCGYTLIRRWLGIYRVSKRRRDVSY